MGERRRTRLVRGKLWLEVPAGMLPGLLVGIVILASIPGTIGVPPAG